MTKIVNIGGGISPPQNVEQQQALKKALELEARMILHQAQTGEWNPEEQTLALEQGSHDVRFMESKGTYKDGTVFRNGEVVIQIDDDLTKWL